MEAGILTDDFVRELARGHRVLMLGGMADIAYGLSPAKDSDVWLELLGSAAEWAACLQETMIAFPNLQVWSLARRCVLAPHEIAADAEEFGVVRVNGLTLPRCLSQAERTRNREFRGHLAPREGAERGCASAR